MSARELYSVTTQRITRTRLSRTSFLQASTSVPAFFLDANVQGITGADRAREIAHEVVCGCSSHVAECERVSIVAVRL